MLWKRMSHHNILLLHRCPRLNWDTVLEGSQQFSDVEACSSGSINVRESLPKFPDGTNPNKLYEVQTTFLHLWRCQQRPRKTR